MTYNPSEVRPMPLLLQSTTGGGPYFVCWRCHAQYAVGCVHYCSTGARTVRIAK